MNSHYTSYNSFTEAFAGFMQVAREAGFKSGIQCSKETLISATSGIWLDKDIFEYALASIFCTSEEEREYFKKVFSKFWRLRGSEVRHRTYKNKKTLHKNSRSIAVMTGMTSSEGTLKEEEAKNTSGANATEALRNTDFTKLNTDQSALLDELCNQLLNEMRLRLKRRKRKAHKGKVDIANSIRKNIQKGGNILDLSFKEKKREKFRLLILLDVSGSMDKYSFYLLKFIWTLRSHFKHIEAFAFSTSLMHITDYLADKNLATSLSLISHHVTNWSSGTQIGKCLQDFNEHYSKRYLNGKTLTLILSDGLDTGEPEILEKEIQKIKRQTKKLVWLNPLKGMEGYEPIQRGMSAAMPSVDHFQSAHNLNSLLALENILMHV
ncbi:MAG: VWA domain-containing protein [Bacteroidota bacterium]